MTETKSIARSGRKSPIITVGKYLLIIVVVYFVAEKLVDNWQEVVNYNWSINWLLLILSVMAHILTFALLAGVWCLLISGFGYRVSLVHAFKISYIANLGRYIPGKIWPVFGMVYLAKKAEVGEEAAVASWGLAQMFAVPASFLACLVTIMIHPAMFADELGRFVGTGVYVAALVIFLISLQMVVVPDKTLLLFNFLLRLFRRPQVSFRLSKTTALMVYVGYFFCWLLFGFSFWLFLNGVIDNPQIPVMGAIAAFVLAYQVGYLTLFSPGGLGIRELALTSLLVPFVGPVAAGVAVASRIWNMASEIIAALIAFKIRLEGE
ncbi:MAG: flippase-like domain-containing protein [Candidatus Zixiibacteriota bacterium]|nr:MAG: flippase-like domain-containing protein [candidate division Zixibacteria bacterium]